MAVWALINTVVLTGFEFIIAVQRKVSLFWVMMPCSRVEVHRRFGSNVLQQAACFLVARLGFPS
jgi:hypothetical protein